MSSGAGGRPSWDLALLWLWGRLAAAAPIQPLAWELPYATGAALKKKKKKKLANPTQGESTKCQSKAGFQDW